MSIFNKSTQEKFTIDQVPNEYREEVKKRLENYQEEALKEEITKGEIGEPISSRKEIKEAFSDSDTIYFGHGTSEENSSVIKPIFETGLIAFNAGRYSHTKSLISTAVVFDYGSNELFEEIEEELNNWNHLNSKYIVILALPKKYLLHHSYIKQGYDEFKHYYVDNEENQMVRPEFVKGVYNAISHTFTPNRNFYKNLSQEKQNKLFAELNKRYIKEFSKSMAEIPKNYELPLSEEQIKELYIEWYTQKIKDSINSSYEEAVEKVVDKMANEKIELSEVSIFDSWDDDPKTHM